MAITKLQPFNLDTTANYTFANITADNANLGNAATANYFVGNGSLLTGISVSAGNSIVNGNSNVTVSANGNINLTAVGNANILVITGTGANITGTLNATGNANTGNLGTTNLTVTGTGSFGANVNMNTYWINNVGYPNLSTDAATKAYVDTMVSSGVSYHEPVAVATTTTLATATSGTTAYNSPNGAANGIGAYISTTGTFNLIDTANVQTVGTRILVKNESNAAWNGVYTYANTTAIVRSTDTDEAGTGSTTLLGINDFFFTTGGSVNKGTGFIVSAPSGTITFGTSNITFSIFSTSQVYDAGTGLTLTGTQFSISNTAVTAGSYGNGDSVATFTVNGQGQLTAASNTAITANAANLTGTTLNSSIVTSSLTSVGSLTGLTVSNSTGVVNFTTTANVTLGSVSNLHIAGGSSSQYLQTDGTGNLSWVTISAGSGISNGNSNISIPSSNGNINLTAGGNTSFIVTDLGANISGNVEATGNITAQYFVGNGYYLTGVDTSPANIANGTSNVQVYFDGNVTTSVAGNANILVVTGTGINVTGNATIGTGIGGNLIGANIVDANTINASGNVNAQYFVGNGYYLTGVDTSPANIANGTSNVQVYFDGNVSTSVSGNANILVVTGTGINVTGNATIGSGTGGNLVGANVVDANLITADNVNASANVNAQYFVGNGYYLTGVDTSPSNIVNGTSNVEVALNGNVSTSVSGNANILVVTGTGINITGNATIGSGTGGNILGANIISATTFTGALANGNSNINIPSTNGNINFTAVGNANILVITGTGANISGTANVTGNLVAGNANLGNAVTANFFIGSGNNLSNISAANISGQVANALIAGTVYTNAQPNITSVGSLTGLTVSNATGIVDFTTTANVTLGAVANLHISGGASSQYLQTDGAGNLTWASISSSSTLANGNSNVNIPTANGNINLTAVGNTTMVVTGTGANITGTLNVTGQSNLGAVGNVVITGGTNGYVLSTNGSGGLSWVAQSSGGSNISNGNSNVNIPSANGNVNITAAGNTTLIITGTGANISGTANVTGNMAAGNFIAGSGTGGNLTGANVISANTFIGALANGNSSVNIPSANGNVNISAVGNANILVVTGTGANITGTLNVTSNANVGNLGTAGLITATGNITGGNIIGIIAAGANTITTTANITGGNIIGIIAAGANTITTTANITGGNLIGPHANGNSNVNIPTANGNINLTAVGNTTLIVTGTGANISGTLKVTGQSNLGAVGNVVITGGTTGQYLQTDGAGNLSWSTVATGSTSNISNGNSNVNIPSANGNINFSAIGNANVVVITGTGVNVAGTLNTTGNTVFSGANVTLGPVGNVKITGGTNGQILQTNGSGTMSWVTPAGSTITVDNFTGNGVETAYTLSATPDSSAYTIVALAGTIQPRTVYTVVGAVLTFSSPPPNTAPIEVTIFTGGLGYSGGPVTSVNGSTGTVVLTTDNISEGSTNLYYSNTRARLAISANASGPLTYNNSTGVVDLPSTANITANVITVNSVVNGGAGTPTLASATSIDITAATVIRATTSPFQFFNCNSSVRDSIAASNGYVIYNTTTNKLQVYANGSWVDLH